MEKQRPTKTLNKSNFKVELESIYDKDREWKINACYQEILKQEKFINTKLKKNDGKFKISKKA